MVLTFLRPLYLVDPVRCPIVQLRKEVSHFPFFIHLEIIHEPDWPVEVAVTYQQLGSPSRTSADILTVSSMLVPPRLVWRGDREVAYLKLIIILQCT